MAASRDHPQVPALVAVSRERGPPTDTGGGVSGRGVASGEWGLPANTSGSVAARWGAGGKQRLPTEAGGSQSWGACAALPMAPLSITYSVLHFLLYAQMHVHSLASGSQCHLSQYR